MWDSPVTRVLTQLALAALLYSLRAQKHPAMRLLHQTLTVLAAALAAPTLKAGLGSEMKKFQRELRKLSREKPEYNDTLQPIIALLQHVK